MNRLNKAQIFCLLSSCLGWAGVASAITSQGGDYTITRSLSGASGASYVAGGDGYAMGYSAGEPTAGQAMTGSDAAHAGGYYSGWIGNGVGFQLASSQIPGTGPLLSGVQTGVALSAQLRIDFTDQVDPSTLNSGISLTIIQDHLGQGQNGPVLPPLNYDPAGMTVYIHPQSSWLGNTLYDLYLSSGIRNLDGSAMLNPTHIRFLTLLDPQQSNVVLQPVDAGVPTSARALGLGSAGPVSLQVAPRSMTDYSLVLVNSDPLHSPTRINPQIIQDANRAAAAQGGRYMAPVVIQEINAYNPVGQIMNSLSAPAELSLPYTQSGGLVTQMGPVRADTLTLWALDEQHHVWVRMPNTSNSTSANTATGSITRLGVFALMGMASGDAQSVYIYPNPWRPNGPSAGIGVGLTGTPDGGMTFSNLPSECTITIYTVSGERVRTITHSDLGGSIGRETWDGNTSGGAHAASGVYLWRVQSSADARNGKLMVIR